LRTKEGEDEPILNIYKGRGRGVGKKKLGVLAGGFRHGEEFTEWTKKSKMPSSYNG